MLVESEPVQSNLKYQLLVREVGLPLIFVVTSSMLHATTQCVPLIFPLSMQRIILTQNGFVKIVYYSFMKLLMSLLVSILSFALAQAQTNSSQQKIVAKAEIDKKELKAKTIRKSLSKAKTIRKSLSYREKTSKFEYHNDEKVAFRTSTIIKEWSRPGRFRLFEEINDSQSSFYCLPDGHCRSEYISIGNKSYGREGDGPWKEKAEMASEIEMATQKEASVTNEYLYLGEQSLNGAQYDVYRIITKVKMPYSHISVETETVKDISFDKKGRLLKVDTHKTEKTQYGPKDKFENSEHELIEYEYDVLIKIEAPVK